MRVTEHLSVSKKSRNEKTEKQRKDEEKDKLLVSLFNKVSSQMYNLNDEYTYSH